MCFASNEIDDHYMNLLENLVNINSDSTNIKGIDRCLNLLKTEFSKIGFKSKVYSINGRKITTFETEDSIPEVLLLGHIDTVHKLNSPFNSARIENGKMYGPGVVDMKGGLVLIANLLRDINDTNLLKKIKVVIMDEEELGSPNTKETLKEISQGIKYVLIYEPGLPNGNYVTGHSGVKWVKIDVEGKAAHAGLEHKIGLNSIVELANKIEKISDLTNYQKGLTINVGLISGGTKPNVVPQHADATIDIRYKNVKDLDFAMNNIKNIVSHSYVYNKEINLSTKSKITEVAQLPAMPKEKAEKLDDLLSNIAHENSLKITGEEVGYGSDGNHLSTLSLNIIDGLGPYGGGMHTNEEFMLLESYNKRLELSKMLLNKILNKIQTDNNK
jgi:glutamate carboxypeptidase